MDGRSVGLGRAREREHSPEDRAELDKHLAEEKDELADEDASLYHMGSMTAIEVIDQIKALPPDERAKVGGFVHEMESVKPERTMDGKTFEQSAKQVFDRHADLMRKLSQ